MTNYHQALDAILDLHDKQNLSPKEFLGAVEQAHNDMSDAIETLLVQAEELEERVAELLEQVEEFENKYDRLQHEFHHLQDRAWHMESMRDHQRGSGWYR